MKKTTLFLVLFLFAKYGYSQKSDVYVDSLKQALKSHPAADSISVSLLIDLANSLGHNKPDEAIGYADEAINLAHRIGWSKGAALAYREKGVIYYSLSDYMKAIENYQFASREQKGQQDERFEGSMYNNIGNLYIEMGSYPEALTNFYKYLQLARRFQWRREGAIALMNIGLVHMKQEKWDSAIYFFRTSIDSATAINDRQVLAYSLSNLGVALGKSGYTMHDTARMDQAVIYYKRSIVYADSINDRHIKIEDLGGLAEVAIFRKDYPEAEKWANASLALSRELKIAQQEKEMYELLSDVYAYDHKPEKALEAYKTFVALRDSVMNEDKRSEIVKLEMKYDLEKQQALADSEIRRQRFIRNILAGGALLLLVAAAVSFVFYKRKQDARQRQRAAEFRAQVLDTEMKALRARMNPHFIFNSLNSIGYYISKNNLQEADDYLVKFSRLMRAILENSEQKEVSLANDLAALELYMQLESKRLDHKFSYDIQISPDIDPENTMIPPLILQPFVENSIWHGISRIEGQGKITIRILKEKSGATVGGNVEMIRCIVEDNGVGIDAVSLPADRKSLGMKLTRARIDVINKTKNTEAMVRLSAMEQGGTRAEITLPLELRF